MTNELARTRAGSAYLIPSSRLAGEKRGRSEGRGVGAGGGAGGETWSPDGSSPAPPPAGAHVHAPTAIAPPVHFILACHSRSSRRPTAGNLPAVVLTDYVGSYLLIYRRASHD